MNEHKNIITIEDEIKEFSDKPVKSSALFKALKEQGVPDSSSANVGDVLTKGEDGIGWSAPSGGGGLLVEFGTELKGSGFDIYVESTTLETDVIQAIASGKPVVFHFPELDDGSALIEGYVNLTAYYPTPISGEKYCLNAGSSIGGSNWNYVDAIDGKMVAYVYVD